MGNKRRGFVINLCVGISGLMAGCQTFQQTNTESSTNDEQSPEDTPTVLPRECAQSVHASELSPASREEFQMALDEDGLTRDNEHDFEIREELPNVDDEIGGETCVRFQGDYYYPIFGPVGGPDEDWNLEYKLAGDA